MAQIAKKFNTNRPDASTDTNAGNAAAAPAFAFRRYLAFVLLGVSGALAAFYGALLMLQSTDNLPPPAFANSLCIDEKLSFMREQPAGSPNLLVIGSSVAWRHFDGATVASQSKGVLKPLNGAFCGLHVNQSAFTANWLLDRLPSIRQVVLIAAPQDFSECSINRQAIFNRQDADDYVYGGASPWPYYLRYFSPVSLMGNARRVKARRANLVELDPLVFTAYGDGPLKTADSLLGLGYGQSKPLDPTCFQALESLAQRLQKEGRPFTVVSSPLHPDWKTTEDASGEFINDFDARLVQSLKATSARFWDADSELKTSNAAFTDALHLRWSAAQDFSIALAKQLLPAHSSQ
jgi:hypothetical protein